VARPIDDGLGLSDDPSDPVARLPHIPIPPIRPEGGALKFRFRFGLA